MRRPIFFALGILELLSAVILIGVVRLLPGPAEIRDRFARVERVGRQAGVQVKNLRHQVRQLRERPQLRKLAQQSETQIRSLGDRLGNQESESATFRALSDSFGDVAKGLDGLSDTLSPDGLGRIDLVVKTAADALDLYVVPAADEVADRVEQTTASLRADAAQLADLLHTVPLDAHGTLALYEGLGRLNAGLDRVAGSFTARNVIALRKGLHGLEMVTADTLRQTAALAAITYPAVTIKNGMPAFEYRKVWPEGELIVQALRQAHLTLEAAEQQVGICADVLPVLRSSVGTVRQAAGQLQSELGRALDRPEQLEAVLAGVTTHAAHLADELPRLGDDLAIVLRNTTRLRDAAAHLRSNQKSLEQTLSRWPGVRRNLARSADLLRAAQARFQYVIDHQKEYEASIQKTQTLLNALAAALPLYVNQFEHDLREQEHSLTALSTGIDEVTTVLPEASVGAARLLLLTRVLLGLLAGIFCLHGSYLSVSAAHRSATEAGAPNTASESPLVAPPVEG